MDDPLVSDDLANEEQKQSATHTPDVYRVYWVRWRVLAIVSCLALLQGWFW